MTNSDDDCDGRGGGGASTAKEVLRCGADIFSNRAVAGWLALIYPIYIMNNYIINHKFAMRCKPDLFLVSTLWSLNDWQVVVLNLCLAQLTCLPLHVLRRYCLIKSSRTQEIRPMAGARGNKIPYPYTVYDLIN